ncbi:MAG: hypothetical protein WCW14_00140 [Candidatus Paceibacterota bacterium]|jgi:hypothetical protein
MISFSIYWLILPAAIVLFFIFGFDVRIREKSYRKKLTLLIERLGCRTVVHRTISDAKNIDVFRSLKFVSKIASDFAKDRNLSVDKVGSDLLDLNARDVLSCNVGSKEITISILFLSYDSNPAFITHNFFVKIPTKYSVSMNIKSVIGGLGNCKTIYSRFNSRFYSDSRDVFIPEKLAEYCQNFEYGVSISTKENFLYFSSQMYPKDFSNFVQKGVEVSRILDTL